MIKPLLRVIPTMSGNVKLACSLQDFISVTSSYKNIDIFETSIKYAKLLPISHNLFQDKLEAKLLGSSWEFDLKKFYSMYSDIFFGSEFIYDKINMIKLDPTINQDVRCTDFEMGTKRISYQKNNAQFAFFAPIYIDSSSSIPKYFKIDIVLYNGLYNITKEILVKLNCDTDTNYLYKYLYKYVSQIDDNVVFLNNTDKTATYYGIDLVKGGFVKVVDTVVSRVFTLHNTIDNFDATICQGFKSNQIAMKQIIPLTFYFDINDLLTTQEKTRYNFSEVTVSGCYIDINDNELPYYDFQIDYDEFSHPIKLMNEDGVLKYVNGYVDNIMDVDFPSLNEAHYINYNKSANKLTVDFCRWKLKYSDDDYPYIANMSWAFSKNQNSTYKYHQFPCSFNQLKSLAESINDSSGYSNYSLIFPLNDDIETYNNYNKSISSQYENIFNQYCLNWFEVVDSSSDKFSLDIWEDVNSDGCVFYNGILYDLNNIYNLVEDPVSIDKFAVIIQPVADVFTLNSSSLSNSLIFADFTIHRQGFNTITVANAVINDSLLSSSDYLYESENPSKYTDQVEYNGIFSYSSDNTGNFVDINDLGLDYYEINKYYIFDQIYNAISYMYSYYKSSSTFSDIAKTYLNKVSSIDISSISDYSITGYVLIPIYRTATITYLSNIDENANNSVVNLNGIDISQVNNISYAYIRTMEDAASYYKSMLISYNVTDEETDTTTTYLSYLSVFNTNYNDITNGNSIFEKKNLIRSSYISSLNTSINTSVIQEAITYMATTYFWENWSYSDIASYYNSELDTVSNSYSYASYLYKELIDAIGYINSYISSLNNITSFQFNPWLLSPDTKTTFAYNAFIPSEGYSSKFYGDNLTSYQTSSDFDVLWCDIYNLSNVYTSYYGDDSNFTLTSYNTYTFFNKFLDKDHIFYYYTSLHYDESGTYQDDDENVNWFSYGYWKNDIYKKYKVIIDNPNDDCIKVRYMYKLIDADDDFATWYESIEYDSDSMLFNYVDDEDDKFDLVFKKQMYRVDESLWNLINIESNSNYKDLYIYRIEKPYEYESRISGYTNTLYFNSSLDDDCVIDYDDSMLIPLFDDILEQDISEAEIVSHYLLNNILSISVNYPDGTSTLNYKYNSNQRLMMIEISDEEKELYGITKSYTKYDNNKNELIIENNDLEYDDYLLNTKTVNGINYGYYLIQVNYSNSSNSFDTLGITSSDEYEKLKYIYYINNINITQNPNYFISIYKNIAPFLVNNPIILLLNINTLLFPNTYNIQLMYKSVKYIDENIDEELSEVSIIKKNINKKINLTRYMHSISPLITQTTTAKSRYKLKFKNVNTPLVNTSKYNSIGDSNIYDTDGYINKFDSHNVYTTSLDEKTIKSYNNIISYYTPFEYKHFNASKFYNLEPHFTITDNKKRYTYEELLSKQSDDVVYSVFEGRLHRYMQKSNIDKNLILFLLGKYKVSFDTTSVGLSIIHGEKIYSLKYVFDLL